MNNNETNLKNMLNKAEDEIRQLKEELEKYHKHNARGAGRKGRITEDDKIRIFEMRNEGISYGKIAEALHLPIGSVFNYSKLFLNDNNHTAFDNADNTASYDEAQDFINRFAYRNIMSSLRSKT
jgi:hypothetical protein